MIRTATAAVTFAVLTAACGAPAAAPPEPDGTQVLGADIGRVQPAVSDQDVAALTGAQTAFALDLYHAVRQEIDGDLVVGPTSLHTLLAIVRAGARGQTAAEMDQVLHSAGLDLHAAGNALDRALQDRNGADGIELATANRLWVQPGLGLLDDYVATIARNYGAGLAATDFAADPDAARQTINRWVSGATRERIDELFPQGSITGNTKLALTNAVFLDAAWRFPFDPEHTVGAPFTLEDGTTVSVPTMRYDEYLPSAWGQDWAAVELPYDGEKLSMVVIVPQDLAAFEERLTPELLAEVLGTITDGGIHLSLPRFTARTHLGLTDTLTAMGMPSAFGGDADFSGMTGSRGLFVQAVEHEAVVEVDEEGTVAAAASGAAMADSHGPTVTVDRPFLFVIRDEPTGAILFLGRVTDPR